VSFRQKRIWTAGLALHFFLVLSFSLQDFAATVSSAATPSTAKVEIFLERLESIASTGLGQHLSVDNPFRQFITAYGDCTGIEAGYSYFAPAVPGNSKLGFELHYPDGRVDYDIPVVAGAAAGYRLATLLDHLRTVHYVRLREALLQTLVKSIHREHPDAVLIRAVFGVAELTTPAEYDAGKRTSYRALYVYDFRFRPATRSHTPGPKE